MQYTEKTGVITKVGPKRTEFPNGSRVTIKFKQGGVDKTVDGVSVGVQFDFDKDVWYSGILFEKQANELAEGKTVNVKLWEKESNGKVYKNFAIVSPKKADTAELEKAINELKTTVERHSQQIVVLVSELKVLKDWKVAYETTTAFDENFSEIHPQKAKELNEYNNIQTIADMEAVMGMPTADDLDISPDDIPF